jgi:hypothetical protein
VQWLLAWDRGTLVACEGPSSSPSARRSRGLQNACRRSRIVRFASSEVVLYAEIPRFPAWHTARWTTANNPVPELGCTANSVAAGTNCVPACRTDSRVHARFPRAHFARLNSPSSPQNLQSYETVPFRRCRAFGDRQAIPCRRAALEKANQSAAIPTGRATILAHGSRRHSAP